MMTRFRGALVAAIATAAFTASTQAATVVGFYLNASPTSPAPDTFAATTVATGLTVDPLSRGSGLVASGLARGFSSGSWTIGAASAADAAAANEYLQFSFTVADTYHATLSTLATDTRRSGAGPTHFQWQYSFDGFAAGTTPGVIASYDHTGSNTNGETDTAIDLSGIADLQNITAGTTVTFRLYGWGSTTDTSTFAVGRLGNNGLSNNDLELVGTVATPEPASLTLLGLGSVALLRRRRA